MSSLPGITRQDEEKRLQHTLEIAQRKVDANRQSVQALAEELHAMQEEFDENDKEAQTLWHNADARFKFVNQDLRRAEQARKKPYFGRIDFRDKKLKKDEVYYIGRSVIADNPAEPEPTPPACRRGFRSGPRRPAAGSAPRRGRPLRRCWSRGGGGFRRPRPRGCCAIC